jgi:putative peptide zinc metalloprotease protein
LDGVKALHEDRGGPVKTFLTQLMARRVFTVALALVLLVGAGSARADFDPNYTSGTPETAAETSPTPEPSSSPAEGGVTPPEGGGGNVNNEVVVINTVDERAAARAGFGVARVTGTEARNQNAAAATSSCDDCRTVAVAAQVVIIQRTNATEIAPRNYAIAINSECVRCETFAAAYQYVFTTDGLVRFEAGAQQKLAGVQEDIRHLVADEDLTFAEMEAKIDALVERMWAIARSELEAAGVQGTGRPSKDTDKKTTGGASPSPSPSAEPSESPSPDADSDETDGEPSPSPSPTASPSTEPSETPSPEPS